MPEVPPSASRLDIQSVNYISRDLHRQILAAAKTANDALAAINLLKQSGGSSTTPAPIPTTPPIPVYYGTVTSVGLSMPARFSVAPSVITEANIFVVTDVVQVKNTFLAGPLTGADATPTYRVIGTADLPLTAVVAGSYGDAATVATFTVDATGRITVATNVAIAIAASQITSGTLAAARMPALTGDVTSTVGTVATTLATVNANVGAFGGVTQTLQVTYDGKGRATAVAAVSIAIDASQIVSGVISADRLPTVSVTTNALFNYMQFT